MGYIAYVAGTLIVAAVLHSFVTKKPSREGSSYTELEKSQDVSVVQSELELPDVKVVEPVVSIEISHDDDGDEGTSTGTSTPRWVEAKDNSQSIPPKDEISRATSPELSAPNRHVSNFQSEMLPPPPRPSSTPNLAALARQTKAMPPPSSLPPSRPRSPPRLKPATVSSLAPSLRSGNNSSSPLRQIGSSLAPPPSAASSLRIPVQRVLANTHMQPQPALAPSTSTQPPSKRPSRKVILSPGHSPLDWASLTRSTSPSALLELRGKDATSRLGLFRMARVTPSQLRAQNGRKGKDTWTSFRGRVYNVGAYLDFHPGGREELMRGAGRASDRLFEEVHPWVNWEGMLGSCVVGMLVAEDDEEANAARDRDGDGEGNELNEMD